MLYCNVVPASKIAKNEKEFKEKSERGEVTYYVNKQTVTEMNTQLRIPISYIFDVLKYGNRMMLLTDTDDGLPYPTGAPIKYTIGDKVQVPLAILDVNSKECVDFIMKNVPKNKIRYGYMQPDFISSDIIEYFQKKLNE